MRELQQIHETVLDTSLFAVGFRRKIAAHVEETGELTGDAGHRPAMPFGETLYPLERS